MKKTYLLLLTFIFLAGNIPAFSATLNLNLFIEGHDAGCDDTIIVELHDPVVTSTIAGSFKTVLMFNGNATATFSNSVIGNAYYIAVRHRSAVETWSASTVTMSAVTAYDFTSAQCSAYECNMIQVNSGPNVFAFYNGDINQDGNIDQIDFPPMDFGINNGIFGYYPADLNCDGNVDLLDFPTLDSNMCSGIYAHFP